MKGEAGRSGIPKFRAIAACFVLIAVTASAAPGVALDALNGLLPAAVEPGGWRVSDTPQVFGGKELFGYMDGGADVVLEYGFRRVIVQDYKDAGGRTITAEVFEVDTPADAYGLFTFKTGPEGEPGAIGAAARLADYYLNVWKGPFVVTLTGLDESPEVRAGLEAIGREVAARIKGPSPQPAIVGLLPAAGRLEGTVKFFQGRLGLYQSLPYFRSDVFAFAAGAKADYSGSLSLFLLEYPAPGPAPGRFEAIRRAFREDTKFSGVAESGGVLEARDAKGRAVLVKASGRFIVIVLASAGGEPARGLLAGAEENLARGSAPPGR